MARKRTPPPAPPTQELLLSMLQTIIAQVERDGVTTWTPYQLQAAVRVSLALAAARLDINRLPPE